MTLNELAEFFAILTILEPDSEVCKAAARLAQAGTATEGETDTKVLLDLKNYTDKMVAELKEVDEKSLERKQGLVTKILD